MKATGSAVWQGGLKDGKGTISILGGIVDINMGALTVLK